MKSRSSLCTQGTIYDLEEILREMNRTYFEARLQFQITWFQSRSFPRRRLILGVYYFERQLIKINRYLDQPFIPPYFIAYVVYHEMLHQVFPPLRGIEGRRRVHHAEFKMHEKRFKEYEKAHTFRQQLPLLLKRKRV